VAPTPPRIFHPLTLFTPHPVCTSDIDALVETIGESHSIDLLFGCHFSLWLSIMGEPRKLNQLNICDDYFMSSYVGNLKFGKLSDAGVYDEGHSYDMKVQHIDNFFTGLQALRMYFTDAKKIHELLLHEDKNTKMVINFDKKSPEFRSLREDKCTSIVPVPNVYFFFYFLTTLYHVLPEITMPRYDIVKKVYGVIHHLSADESKEVFEELIEEIKIAPLHNCEGIRSQLALIGIVPSMQYYVTNYISLNLPIFKILWYIKDTLKERN
jgi:hypothetical protein